MMLVKDNTPSLYLIVILRKYSSKVGCLLLLHTIRCILFSVNALLRKWVLISSLGFGGGGVAGVFCLFVFNNVVFMVNGSLKYISFLVQSVMAGVNKWYLTVFNFAFPVTVRFWTDEPNPWRHGCILSVWNGILFRCSEYFPKLHKYFWIKEETVFPL